MYFRQYGLVFVCTYLGVYVTTLASIFMAIKLGFVVDDDSYHIGEGEVPNPIDPVEMTVWWKEKAKQMGLGRWIDVDHLKPEHGAFVIAWVATKFMEPIRAVVSIALTPRFARMVGRAPPLQLKFKPVRFNTTTFNEAVAGKTAK